jgi:hypothetical protein
MNELLTLAGHIRRNSSGSLFDPVRKKWVKATPEEFVRQLFITYLEKVLGYSTSRMGVERKLVFENLNKRFDIVVYDKNNQPFILVECKSFESELNQDVWYQAARYNHILKACYLCITNGRKTLIASVQHDQKNIERTDVLPSAH